MLVLVRAESRQFFDDDGALSGDVHGMNICNLAPNQQVATDCGDPDAMLIDRINYSNQLRRR